MQQDTFDGRGRRTNWFSGKPQVPSTSWRAPLCIQTIQEHSANPIVDPQQMTMCGVPCQFSDGSVAGGCGRNVNRQATFFSLVNLVTDKKQTDPTAKGFHKIDHKHLKTRHNEAHLRCAKKHKRRDLLRAQ